MKKTKLSSVLRLLPLFPLAVACGATAGTDFAMESSESAEGATVPDSEQASLDADPGGRDGEFGSVKQALGVGLPIVEAFDKRGFGGNIVEQDFFYNVGKLCDTGHERVDAVQTKWDGLGACTFDAWINAGNVHDCTARIHAHTNAFFGGGNCETTVFEQRSTGGSCGTRGRVLCGGPGNDGSCFCDPACTLNGDCCADKVSLCG